eukprot:CAMPEP_0170588744 /NCGR_PEP_ID=MMETSP0224-20130122/10994_1 /TAXON_ID=285029 /ORGANISM="Togula jolla, Strain CCCM 725" /LENGTH=101 /DNA_ID=CAMNT_0010912483 /DNA_START=96 /DNA_END=398 /DNA_ORIENTATION=+
MPVVAHKGTHRSPDLRPSTGAAKAASLFGLPRRGSSSTTSKDRSAVPGEFTLKVMTRGCFWPLASVSAQMTTGSAATGRQTSRAQSPLSPQMDTARDTGFV